jgi:predicted XRE-type DNA-binding protein
MSKGKGSVRVVPGNVFQQLGFSPDESAALKMRAELHSSIVHAIKQRDYSRAKLAEMFDTDQPRISNLMRGKLANFNLETPVVYAETLGMKPQIKTNRLLTEMLAAR